MAAITAQVTSAGRNLFAAAAMGTDSCQITYVAVGTSNTTPTANDKKLAAESAASGARKSIVNSGTVAAGVNPGELIITITLQAPDASNVAIQEVGFFGGKSATSTKDSGVLIARALYSHTKLPTENLTLTFDLTV
jgi:hypothetical protein